MAKKKAKQAATKRPVKKSGTKQKVAKKPAVNKAVGKGKKKAVAKKVNAKTSIAKKAIAKKTVGRAKPRAVAVVAPSAPPPPPPAPAVGSYVWHELMTNDADRAGDFYQGLFNWGRSENEMIPGVTYTIFRNAGKDVAGMMTMAGPDWEGQPSRWIPYVKVRDIEASMLKATQLGGRVVVPASEIPAGRFAVVADPTGVTIGVFTPASAIATQAGE